VSCSTGTAPGTAAIAVAGLGAIGPEPKAMAELMQRPWPSQWPLRGLATRGLINTSTRGFKRQTPWRSVSVRSRVRLARPWLARLWPAFQGDQRAAAAAAHEHLQPGSDRDPLQCGQVDPAHAPGPIPRPVSQRCPSKRAARTFQAASALHPDRTNGPATAKPATEGLEALWAG